MPDTITESKPPEFVTGAQEKLVNQIDGVNSEFPALDTALKAAPPTAEWGIKDEQGNNLVHTYDTQLGAQALRNNDPAGAYDQSKNLYEAFANTGSLYAGDSTEGMDKYFNKYLSGVLDPQIREIGRALQLNLKDIGAQAHQAGAFGDSRHGVVDGVTRRGAMEAVGNAVGRARHNAFREALAGSRADKIRKEGALENAVNRLLSGGTALEGATTNQLNANRRYGTDLLTIGEHDKIAKQEYENWLYQNHDKVVELENLLQSLGIKSDILGSIRHGTKVTQEDNRPDNTGWSAAGSFLMEMLGFGGS